ncbi:hypothetical protein ACFFGH_18540 [Lysobacter korlensis]|uniref:ZIP Zinc transporter n=1 Tax=Lysobacter korlensis TaxID=553636 RepID=A0ABV6RS93_9GAMM
MQTLALVLAAALAMVHVFAGRLRFLDHLPRTRWLSFASGISVAYVFVHLLPEISRGQAAVAEMRAEGAVAAESLLWMVALLGLAVFYGLERLALTSRAKNASEGDGDRTEAGVFWLHIGSFALYNVLIGYLLLHQPETDTGGLLFFWAAMAVHFIVNDHGLREHHQHRYQHAGRWLLAAATVIGALLGLATDLGEATVATLTAFLGGGVVLNVLKEELPEERKSRYVPFVLGAAIYTALLMAL